MATLDAALKTFVPALHAHLRKCARRAVPVALGDPFALHTVKGSLGAFKQVEKRGYVDTTAYTLSEEAQAAASLATEQVPVGNAKKRMAEDGAYVPVSLPLWCSKFGGFGYLPKSHAYPTNLETGTPLALLVQINFGELRAQWAAASKNEISATHVFLDEPLWPSRGILAFYTDPFDDLYGSDMEDVGEQKKFRVLYFEDVDEVVEPTLRGYWDSQMTAEEAEEALASKMWSREEQYAEFAKAAAADEQLRDQNNFLQKPDDMSVDTYEKLMRIRREEMWKPECRETLEALGAPEFMIPRKPALWYGNPINREFPMLLVTEDMPLDMTPLQSVEFKALVAGPAVQDHPEARRSVAGEHWALPSQFTEAAREEEDEFGDEDAYECEYNGNVIGGYPAFTQDDPRDANDPAPDMLLFGCGECSEKLMWGDAGICNFFIAAKDLADRNFGAAWYTWDCC